MCFKTRILDSLSRGLKALKKLEPRFFSELTVSVSLERYPSRDSIYCIAKVQNLFDFYDRKLLRRSILTVGCGKSYIRLKFLSPEYKMGK